MRCPSCGDLDDRVVDSRTAADGNAIRRRRECAACGARFTTFERMDPPALVVVKRSGDRMAFDRALVVRGIGAAAKGRPVHAAQVEGVVAGVEAAARAAGQEITTTAIGREVLERLRDLDAVTALRFASVYKGFDDVADFEAEIGILQKQSAPKRHRAPGVRP